MNRNGITIIEVIFVLALGLIFAAAAVPIYGNVYSAGQNRRAVSDTVDYFRTAREYAAARVNNLAHGVHLTVNGGADVLTFFAGTSYVTRNTTYDRVLTFPDSLTVTTDLTGSQTVFARGTAIPNNTGTITIVHATGGTATVSVNALGVVDFTY